MKNYFPRIQNIIIHNKQFVALCILFICLYSPRYILSINMRKLLSQSKVVRVAFTVYRPTTSYKTKQTIETQNIIITLPQDHQIRIGDEVVVIGTIDKGLLEKRKDKIYLISQSLSIQKRSSSSGKYIFFEVLRFVQASQGRIFHHFEQVMGEPHAGLLWGILLGGNQALSDAFLSEISITGLNHVLSASGFNVVIVLTFSLGIFIRAFPRRIAIISTLGIVLVYSFLSGFNPPIMRAALMALLYLIGELSGREYQARWAIWISAGIMLISQPFLIYSLSFQFSFLSTIGLLYLLPALYRKKHCNKEGFLWEVWFILEENFWTTLSAYLMTVPLILLYFGKISLIAPLVNVFLLWMVAPLMFLGGLAIPLVVLAPPWLYQIILIPLWFLLEVFIRVVHVFSIVPNAQLEVVGMSRVGVMGWYFSLVGYMVLRLADKE
jgi:competence protein ComEC